MARQQKRPAKKPANHGSDDPDVMNPKGFILTRSFPEHYGRTVRQQLRNRLLLAGFTNIRLTRTVQHDAAWAVKMDQGTNRESSDREELIGCLIRITKDVALTIERAGIAAAVSDGRIEVSFIPLPPA